MRSLAAAPARLVELTVLRSKQVEKQAIVEAAIDLMALALPADQAEAQALDDSDRLVVFDCPGVDRMKAEVAERNRHELRAGEIRKSAAAEGFVSAYAPEHRGLENAVHAGEADDPDRRVVAIRRI